jgi:uncharacterized protein YbgA (DUF1722 family)/uncharacterized protein YbbK (DUF523 family)
VRIAVSGCLNGLKCRYDGKSKKDDFISEILPKFVETVSFCPEDRAFGTPRESMRIVEIDGSRRVIGNKSKKDFTDELNRESQKLANSFIESGISGIIFKSKSPSCGLERVRVYDSNGVPMPSNGVGLFADAMQKAMPLLPKEEEGRLQDSWLRENFMMQIYAYNSFDKLRESAKKFGDLVQFHSQYKFLLHSKDEVRFRELGRVVADGKSSLKDGLERYEQIFKEAISVKSSIGKTYNVLEHLYGFLKSRVEKSEKEALLESMREFKDEIVPLITPISMVRLYAKKYEIEYLQQQKFLDPYPKELALRSSLEANR